VYIVNSALGTSDITATESWLMSRYGGAAAFSPQPGTPPILDGLVGAYSGESYDAGARLWRDVSGAGNNAVAGGAGSITVAASSIPVTSTAASGSRASIIGSRTASLTWPSGTAIQSGYTLFHVTRYAGTATNRIYDATVGNFASGFYQGVQGMAVHGAGATISRTTPAPPAWVISSDQVGQWG
jgi:hypothetical protein